MVQFVRGAPRLRDASKVLLSQSIGEGLGNFAGTYFANRDLDRLLSDKALQNAPVSERLSALESFARRHGERGQKYLQNRMMVEQQKEQERQNKMLEEEQFALARLESGEELTPQERAKLSPNTQLKYAQVKKQKEERVRQKAGLRNALIKANVPEEIADQWSDLYDTATEGGKTEIMKGINDLIRRGKLGEFAGNAPKTQENAIEADQNMDFPELPEEPGLTPADQIKRQDAREKVNTPLYLENSRKLQGYEDEIRDIHLLQQLDEGDKIPTGIEKWNVNPKTGELIIPAQASPEAQLFVKTVNNFLKKAKEFFPGRVTNFDLESFKTGLPTLANSKEGRALILKNMELSNRIANLKEESLQKAFDHYGVDKPIQKINKIANDNYKRLKTELEERLKTLDGLLKQGFNKETGISSENKRLDVYDQSGNLVGDIDESEKDQLPEGYIVK